MITRRRFFKKAGLLVATLLVAPKVLLQQKETLKIVPYNHEFPLNQRRDLKREINEGLAQWMADKRDEEIFAVICRGYR